MKLRGEHNGKTTISSKANHHGRSERELICGCRRVNSGRFD